MSVADIAVVIASVAALAGLGWFFFAPRKARTAELARGCATDHGDGAGRVQPGFDPDPAGWPSPSA